MFKVYGFLFWVFHLGFGVSVWFLGLRFSVFVLGFGVSDFGFRVL